MNGNKISNALIRLEYGTTNKSQCFAIERVYILICFNIPKHTKTAPTVIEIILLKIQSKNSKTDAKDIEIPGN